ncbi:MAG: hypothetical protein QW727_00025 [Candidatus Pacearchaeota archaeon]
MKDVNVAVIFNLNLTEERVFKKIHKDVRASVRKAERENLIIMERLKKQSLLMIVIISGFFIKIFTR